MTFYNLFSIYTYTSEFHVYLHKHTNSPVMIKMKRGSRKLWWFIPCTHKKRLRTASHLDIEEMLRTELTTINEDSDTYDPINRAETPRKRAKMGKKVKKEEMGRVFTTQFSIKNSYALFLDRMTSSRSFGRP